MSILGIIPNQVFFINRQTEWFLGIPATIIEKLMSVDDEKYYQIDIKFRHKDMYSSLVKNPEKGFTYTERVDHSISLADSVEVFNKIKEKCFLGALNQNYFLPRLSDQEIDHITEFLKEADGSTDIYQEIGSTLTLSYDDIEQYAHHCRVIDYIKQIFEQQNMQTGGLFENIFDVDREVINLSTVCMPLIEYISVLKGLSERLYNNTNLKARITLSDSHGSHLLVVDRGAFRLYPWNELVGFVQDYINEMHNKDTVADVGRISHDRIVIPSGMVRDHTSHLSTEETIEEDSSNEGVDVGEVTKRIGPKTRQRKTRNKVVVRD